MNDDKQMLVSKIVAGTVIDKIPGGSSITILRALKIREDVSDTVAVAIRVSSKSMGTKDIIKMTNKFLDDSELKKIWLVAPDAVISVIKEYKVDEKFNLSEKEFSNEFTGVLVCNNPTCATVASNEPVQRKFILLQRDPMLVRCVYCDRIMLESNVKEQL